MTDSRILKFNSSPIEHTKTTNTGHTISTPPDQDQSIVPEEIKVKALEQIHTRLPRLLENQREVDIWRACWDSVAPDRNQIITQHPHSKLPNLYLAIGGSFHSWKFLPILGKYVVRVLNGEGNGVEKDSRWGWKHYDSKPELQATAQPV